MTQFGTRVEKIRPFLEPGFDEVALVQIGAEHQEPFCRWAQAELLPALRSIGAAGSAGSSRRRAA